MSAGATFVSMWEAKIRNTLRMLLFSKAAQVFEPEQTCGWQKHESYEVISRVPLPPSIVSAYMHQDDNCSARGQ